MIYALFQTFVKITGFLPQLILFGSKFHYEDKAVQSRRIRGKAVVVANHRALLDVGVLMFTFPGRTLRCAAAELLYRKNFFMTTFLRLMGCVRVERDQCDFSFLDRLKAVLDKGGVVEMFPESRLPTQEGDRCPLPFKPSYVYLALEAEAPIIPVYHNGCALRREPLQVVIGKPIDPLALYDSNLSEKENVQIINDYVRSKIIELSRNVPSPYPFGDAEETAQAPSVQ